jgi:hypothetical protein
MPHIDQSERLLKLQYKSQTAPPPVTANHCHSKVLDSAHQLGSLKLTLLPFHAISKHIFETTDL